MRRRTRQLVLTALFIATAGLAPPAQAATKPAADPTLDQAQKLLDAGKPQDALDLVQPVLRRHKDDPRALLLRSTARFMLGDTDGGRADLDRCLQLDPTLRQGWLNRAGLEISEARYDKALESLAKAHALDPDNPDNDLNTGAVYLLQGRLPEATERFRSYLQSAPDAAAAHYLVATNYAGRGYARLAVETLRRAIQLDDLYRVRARTDPNFEGVADSPEFKALLEEAPARPPADHRIASQAFPTPYDGGHGQLLSAVLEALHQVGATFDPRVEVASKWALIHGPLRIQLYDRPGPQGGAAEGVVQVSAAPETLGPDQWKQRTGQLFQAVELVLLRRQPRNTPSPKAPLPPGP